MSLITKRLFFIIVCGLISVNAQANDHEPERVKTDLPNKYYRQALYFYFQGDTINALSEVERTELRFGQLDNKTRLFQAGLQVSLGLHTQAQQSLLAFNINQHNNSVDEQQNLVAPELLLVAQLSLAEQLIEQGKTAQAQQVLANISAVNNSYYPQYRMLSQLAYWPEEGKLLSVTAESKANNKSNKDVLYSPYIQLNNALKFIENAQYQQAVDLLQQLKVSTWFVSEATFWQTLFSADLFSFGNDTSDNILSAGEEQSQAINDYAQLLLAQVYVQQENVEAAYFELQSFPQNSPYSESALYLFAYAAEESKHYTSALNLFSLLHKQYPYSHLGWQAGELLAEQITEQKSLAHGLQVYQVLEEFYQQRLTELTAFEKTNYQRNSSPKSIWLEQALQSPSLSHLYQELAQVAALTEKLQALQQKSYWLAETITLNQQRKAALLAEQKQNKQQVLINNLVQQRDELAKKLAVAVNPPVMSIKAQSNSIEVLGKEFANDVERQWLKRIEAGKRNLIYIHEHSKADNTKQQANIIEYQQRLDRVEKVLKWQLNQKFPQRAWQHQQQLHTIDTLLAATKSQQEKILTISQSQHSLSTLIEKQAQGATSVQALLIKSQRLQDVITNNITNTVTQYINKERQTLAQHLLSTKRAMATILEAMASNDNKVEQQLRLQSLERLKEGDR